MTITAKYPTTCCVCHRGVLPGERIEWNKGVPVRHASCRPSAGAIGRPPRPGKWTGCSCGSREDEYGDLIPSPHNCRQCRFDD